MAENQAAAAAAALGALSLDGADGALASPPPAAAAAAAGPAQNGAAAAAAPIDEPSEESGLQKEQHPLTDEEAGKATAPKREEENAEQQAPAAADASGKIAPALPLAIVFDALLEQKVLDAVDVCELGCVCSELSLCVRAIWALAAAHPGSQRRLLRAADDEEEEEDEEEEGLVGLIGADWSLAYKGGETVVTYAFKDEPCSCCGSMYEDRKHPLSYTYPYPFYGEPRLLDQSGKANWRKLLPLRPWRGPFFCRPCYSRASDKRPHHSREERFRVERWSKLFVMYDTPLPRSMLKCAVRRMRANSSKAQPVFCHDTPHASVLRAANFALLRKTPGELQDIWRQRRG